MKPNVTFQLNITYRLMDKLLAPGWSICDNICFWGRIPPGVDSVHLQPHPHLPPPARAPHVCPQHGGEKECPCKGGSGQVKSATCVPMRVEKVRGLPHLLSAHPRQQAQVREVVQGGADRDDHFCSDLLPARLRPCVPGAAGRTAIIARHRLVALSGS